MYALQECKWKQWKIFFEGRKEIWSEKPMIYLYPMLLVAGD